VSAGLLFAAAGAPPPAAGSVFDGTAFSVLGLDGMELMASERSDGDGVEVEFPTAALPSIEASPVATFGLSVAGEWAALGEFRGSVG
jgi:hypothetical protein